MVISLLHAEELLTWIDTAERLASRELLEALVQRLIFDAVGVAGEGDGLLCGELGLQRRSEELGHANFELDIGDELLSIFAFLGMLSSTQVIER